MNVAVWPASFWVTWITVLLCVVAAMMIGAMIVEWWQYTADKKAAKAYLRNVAIGLFWVVVFALLLSLRSHAHDHDHPEQTEWYKTLMQPDNPAYSCCGEADAYWCDIIHVKAGKTFCTITDDRDDIPLKRSHVPLGTEIEIPDQKLKWDRGNPTGHAVVFLSAYGGAVFCFVQSAGI